MPRRKSRRRIRTRVAPPAPPPVHRIFAALLHRVVRVLVVGCGGSGSEIAAGLPLLHQALLARGHPGLDVVLMDGDVVSSTNTVRQPFATADIGHPKATILANRINAFYGLRWRAIAGHLSAQMPRGRLNSDIVIGCVDTRRARAMIAERVARTLTRDVLTGDVVRYWLDLGNDAASGQFVLGVPAPAYAEATAHRLPTAAELYPETVDAARDADDDRPNCSAREALERQEPFINRTLASHALGLLARLFRYGELTHHGGFVNLATGKLVPIPVSPENWARTIALQAAPAPRRRRKVA